MTKKNSRQHAIKHLKNARRSKKDEFYGISKYQRKAIENGGKIYLLVF